MSAYEISGLRQRALNDSIYQHATRSKGTDQEQVIVLTQKDTLDVGDQTYAQKGANKRPKLLFIVNKGFLIHYVPADPVGSFKLLLYHESATNISLLSGITIAFPKKGMALLKYHSNCV